jgi:hypothetical protein
MTWRYLTQWAAWWLMLPNDGVSEERGFGPFNETEAVWAGEVHGVPFRSKQPKSIFAYTSARPD